MEFMAFIGVYFMFRVRGFYPFHIEALYLLCGAWGSVLRCDIVVVPFSGGNCHCVWLAAVAGSREEGTGAQVVSTDWQ